MYIKDNKSMVTENIKRNYVILWVLLKYQLSNLLLNIDHFKSNLSQ